MITVGRIPRRLAATSMLVVATFTFATPAFAGIDTVVQFTNLSPYTATVSFSPGDSECWYDDAPTDSRIAEYFEHYRNDAVSSAGYRGFLESFKAATGVTDFAAVPTQPMRDAHASLAPAVVGEKAARALFVGETSASLFDGCKLATSRRGFDLVLTDESQQVLSHQHFVLVDPPDDRWSLRQSLVGAGKETSIQLGAGGHGDPLEIAFTAGAAILTVVTIGAGVELILARAAVRAAVAELAAEEAFWSELLEYAPRALSSTWRQMFSYALRGGLRVGQQGVAEVYRRNIATGLVARILYAAMIEGSVVIYERLENGTESVPLPKGSKLDAESAGIDFSSPSLLANSGLPEERSICVYQTSTLGITECRVVGIDLTIMPDGSVVFMPLPSVGSGG